MLATVQREHDAKREEAAAAAAAAESACDASTADDSALHEKTLHDLREELAVVKSTASSAISTLSASLKKALYGKLYQFFFERILTLLTSIE